MTTRPEDETETHVTFDGAAILVRSDVPAVNLRIRREFARMTGDGTSTVIATLGIHATSHGFTLSGPSFKTVRHSELEPLIALLKEELRLEFMRSRPDLLWLHAGAVETDGTCMLILGASGQGKSTLSTMLCRKGWRLLSDDVVPIAMDADVAYPFPQMPFRRLPSPDDWDSVQLGSARREELEIGPGMVAAGRVPVCELVFPFFERGASTVLSRLTKGEGALEMLRSSTNFCDHKEMAVARAARMAEVLPAFRLTYGSGPDAAESLHGLRGGSRFA